MEDLVLDLWDIEGLWPSLKNEQRLLSDRLRFMHDSVLNNSS